MSYDKEEKLKLEKQVRVTKEIYKLLRYQKKEQEISMAKIVCNLVKKEYGDSV
jgi:hypothetical protein